jgi:hypothetical protein
MEYEEDGTTWVLPESVSMAQLLSITLMPKAERQATLIKLATSVKFKHVAGELGN